MAADYIVKDLSLADWGRKELNMAEDEMPGLMAVRAEYGKQQQSGECDAPGSTLESGGTWAAS